MGDASDHEKRQRILDAALAKFSAYGFARTSMADIAEAASMSRPALYQHFGNKEEIFRAMLGRMLNDAIDRATESLDADAPLEERLDGFLQRWSGDLAEGFRATEHGDDLVAAKAGHAKPVVEAAAARVRKALTACLADEVADPESLVDILALAPAGLKYDEPSMPRLRRRLSALAASVARAAEAAPK